jgi:hypothetical protein
VSYRGQHTRLELCLQGVRCVASWNSVAVLQSRDNEQLGPYGIGITMVIATQLALT